MTLYSFALVRLTYTRNSQKLNKESVCIKTNPVKTKQFIIRLGSKTHTFGAGRF